jgi:hypothetical protein
MIKMTNKTISEIMRELTKEIFSKILKYEIPLENDFYIDMPCESRILSFQCQNDKPFIWVMVNEGSPVKRRYFELHATGHKIKLDRLITHQYIGTIQMLSGELVWHLFNVLC